MLSCVTLGSMTPGVQAGSGSPLTELQCMLATTPLGAVATAGPVEFQVVAMTTMATRRQALRRTKMASRRLFKSLDYEARPRIREGNPCVWTAGLDPNVPFVTHGIDSTKQIHAVAMSMPARTSLGQCVPA